MAEAFDEFWRVVNTHNPTAAPDQAFKAVMSDEAVADAVRRRATYPKVSVTGRDEVIAHEVRTTSDTEAHVEVCYEVHRRLIVQEPYESKGGPVPAGYNLRTDQNGEPIEDGAVMVNLVQFARDDTSSPWKVHATQVGYKPTCDLDRDAS